MRFKYTQLRAIRTDRTFLPFSSSRNFCLYHTAGVPQKRLSSSTRTLATDFGASQYFLELQSHIPPTRRFRAVDDYKRIHQRETMRLTQRFRRQRLRQLRTSTPESLQADPRTAFLQVSHCRRRRRAATTSSLAAARSSQ